MRFWQRNNEDKNIASIDDWYQNAAGQYLLAEIKDKLAPVLATCFGYYSVQIGCSSLVRDISEHCRVKRCMGLGDPRSNADIKAHPELMPIASDSVDLVILMHCLSLSAEPHAVLREVQRVLIPEGRLIIIDFNPWSIWGGIHLLKSWLEKVPWNGHYYTAGRLNDWMQLLGFDLSRSYKAGYLPPIPNTSMTKYLGWLEKGMRNWLPFSGTLNILVYSKNISPMTPVRHRWVARKILTGKIARPSVGRGMKYDR
ncbi:MAG: SAM-dependent methyltransferase [Gammaproteobacteria bacterium]|jgi:SAM-dependent methyltransferase